MTDTQPFEEFRRERITDALGRQCAKSMRNFKAQLSKRQAEAWRPGAWTCSDLMVLLGDRCYNDARCAARNALNNFLGREA